MNNMSLTGQVNRLRIFAIVRSHMLAMDECPTVQEVYDALPVPKLSLQTIRSHYAALQGATGLPLPMTSGAKRIAANNSFRNQGPLPLDQIKLTLRWSSQENFR